MDSVLSHLYISPLEMCNLNCRMCYTNKVKSVLTNRQIIDFVERYQKEIDLKTVTFCGGEVFTLPMFTNLVNVLTDKNLYIQIITNGTVDRLGEIKSPNSVNLIVSIDGLEEYHDKNRGRGMWQKSMDFLSKAKQLGFQTEIFSIVTQENLKQIPKFEQLMGNIPITYHPRKLFGKNLETTKGFSFLNKEQWESLWKTKKVFPPRLLGCYQISLMSNGLVYGCCEGITPIGKITDNIVTIVKKLKIKDNCAEPDFICGLKGN